MPVSTPPADTIHIDDCDIGEARALAANFGTHRFGYVVTANVDHAIRYHHDAGFRDLYANATYVLLDSRFLVRVLRLVKRQHLRASPGSDLTATIFEQVLGPKDVALVVGGTASQAQRLRAEFGLESLHHIDPPMNFIRDPVAVENCLQQIEAASPFRFCFLAIGSPQQEIIACKLRQRGIARGLALCVGAAINYMTGTERRAPVWMQHQGLEWLFRLLQQPRRLAHRYLVRGPRIFWLASRIELRPRRPPVPVLEPLLPATAVGSTSVATAIDDALEEDELRAAGMP
jgi:exopolysaccharide biosynthesis WecB/TagA/CpsF family protein